MARLFVGEIAVDTFDAGVDRTALFCNGLPGAIGPLPAVLAAGRAGWNVLFVQYPGTYDSAGEFSVPGAVGALTAALAAYVDGALVDPASGRPSPARSPVTMAIGHSFGGFVLTELFRAQPDISIQKALLLAPVFSYQQDPDVGVREDLLDHLDYVRTSRPRTYRFGDETTWATVAAGGYTTDTPSPSWGGQVQAVIGSEDDTFELSVLREHFVTFYRSATGASAVDLQIVEGAGHGMDELINDATDAFLR